MSALSRRLRMFTLVVVLTSDLGQRRVIGGANQLRYDQNDGARARYDVAQ